MSFYGQSQSFYSQQGWLYLGSRTAPPRETFALPFATVSQTTVLNLGLMTTSPIWF